MRIVHSRSWRVMAALLPVLTGCATAGMRHDIAADRVAAPTRSPAVVRAEDSDGGGYLFGDPVGRFNLRGGYAHASANSDVFKQTTDLLSINRGDFSGPVVGGELAFRLAPQVDLSFVADYAGVSRNSHYRNLVDNANREIQQATTFQRVPLTANVRAYLSPRGRAIGQLAWIPARVVPWLGAGGGAMWYRFHQEGDFVDFMTNKVIPLKLESSGLTPAAQGMGGVDITITPRMALTGDARYTWAKARLGRDFDPSFDKLDLSGVSLTLGLTFRL